MILDGVRTAEIIQRKISEEVSRIKEDITLAIFMVGNNSASQIYVHNKEKACEAVGIKARIYKFDDNISQKEILKMVDECNQDETVTGIMVQLPLPSHLDADTICKETDSFDKGELIPQCSEIKWFRNFYKISVPLPKL